MSTTLPTVSDRAQRLMALAEELKVTDQQRRFCEFLAGDPEQNQTRAAEATGSGKSAHVVASKWLKIAKVKAYLAAVREVLGFTRQAGAETEGRIASAQEVLQTMSAHLRGDVDDFLDEYGSFDLQKARAAKKTRLLREMVGEERVLRGAGEDGPEILERKTKFKMVDPQKAADQLARHYRLYPDEDKPAGGGSLTVNVIAGLPVPLQLALAKALLGAKVPTIEAEAKRVG